MTAVETYTGPAEVLAALWSSLERKGATVGRVDIGALAPEQVEAQIEVAGRRLRALREAHVPGPKPITRPPAPPLPVRRDELRKLLLLLAEVVAATDLAGDDPDPDPDPDPDVDAATPGRGAVPAWLDLNNLRHLDPPTGWLGRGGCAGIDPEVFFDPGPDSNYTAARAVCADCPVVYACLVTYLRETSGCWGNTSPNERIAIRRALRPRAAA